MLSGDGFRLKPAKTYTLKRYCRWDGYVLIRTGS
jgi:hypothetical protein